METDTAKNKGRTCKLVVRQPNGTNNLFNSCTILDENDLTWTFKTDRGEQRTESKLYCSIEWTSPAKNGAVV